jgi:hypothetical protein
MHAIVHPADIQDRNGGLMLLATLFGLYPSLRKIFADAGYQGPIFEKGVANLMSELNVAPRRFVWVGAQPEVRRV